MQDVTLEVLKGIRSDLAGVREEVAGVRAELKSEMGELRSELKSEMGELRDRQTEMEIRLATELVAVVGAVRELRDVVVEDRFVRAQVADHEGRIRKLEARRTRPV